MVKTEDTRTDFFVINGNVPVIYESKQNIWLQKLSKNVSFNMTCTPLNLMISNFTSASPGAPAHLHTVFPLIALYQRCFFSESFRPRTSIKRIRLWRYKLRLTATFCNLNPFRTQCATAACCDKDSCYFIRLIKLAVELVVGMKLSRIATVQRWGGCFWME